MKFLFVILVTSNIFALSVNILNARGKFDFFQKENQAIFLTKAKSFIRANIKEEFIINIAPHSKVIIKIDDDKPILKIIRGIARVKTLNKEYKENFKLFLTTNSSALGVRGTEFIITHNDQNQITSLLSIEGRVSLKKRDDLDILKTLKEEIDKKNDSIDVTQTQLREFIQETSDTYIEEGEFSGAYPTYTQALYPTKISKDQFQAIKNNIEFTDQRGKASYKKAKEYSKITNKNLIPEPIEILNSEKMTNREKNIVIASSIRQGGLIDLRTGMYVMPPENAYYNERSKEYELPSNYGGYDSKSGHYIPPKKTILDPLLGFVVQNAKGIWEQVDEFSLGVDKLLKKYKNLTKVDLHLKTNYERSNVSFENYYGEYRYIGRSENMRFNLNGAIDRDLFNNKRYLHNIMAKIDLRIHNRTKEPLVQRNDLLNTSFKYQFQRKYRLSKRAAFSGFSITQNTFYNDVNNRDQFDFYTESTRLTLFESINLSGRHTIRFETGVESFQSYNKADHGNIRFLNLLNSYKVRHNYELSLLLGLDERENKINANKYHRNIFELSASKFHIFNHHELLLKYTYEKHRSAKLLDINDAKLDKFYIGILRKWGEYLKLSLHYSYTKFNPNGGEKDRAFHDNSFGAGLSFFF